MYSNCDLSKIEDVHDRKLENTFMIQLTDNTTHYRIKHAFYVDQLMGDMIYCLDILYEELKRSRTQMIFMEEKDG